MSVSPELPDTAALVARLEETRLELRRHRRDATRVVDDIARRANDLAEEYADVQTGPARTWLLGLRSALMAPVAMVRTPTSPIRAVAERVSAATGLHRLDPVIDHVTARSIPLRTLPVASRETDQPNPGDAIRWLGAVDVHGVVRNALFAHPTSTIAIAAQVEPGARVVASCAIVPLVAAKCADGVVFEISVSSEDEAWTVTARRHVHPRLRWIDRHWRTLEVVLPPGAAGSIVIRLTTMPPQGGSLEHGWAIWGEPRLVWRRPVREIARLGRAVIQRDGLVGAFRRLPHAATTDPNVDYRRWLAEHPVTAEDLARMRREAEALPWKPLFSVVVPTYNTDPRWLRACIDSVRDQVYANWELCIVDDASTNADTVSAIEEYVRKDPRIRFRRLEKNSHISAASNTALDMATGEFVALLDHDDELAPEALFEIARHLNTHPDADFLYTDEDKLDLAGQRCDGYFKPDWSPEHFLNCMYTNHLMVLRRSIVEQVGRFRIGFEGSQDYDLALRVISVSDRVHHVPKVLYHWRKIPGSAAAVTVAKPWALQAARRALESHVERNAMDAEVLDGEVPGLFRVRRRIRGNPLVTIVIPTDDRTRDVDGRLVPLLTNAVRSITQRTSYKNYELLVVDNGRMSDQTLSYLANVPHRRVSYVLEGPFNFSHKLNFCARHAGGEHLVIFNDDLEVINSEWLAAMLEYSQEPAIGVVGAKLFFPDGRLQHIGMVLGVSGVAAHAFHMAPGTEAGYASAAIGPRNYSAVTGACMMTRRAVFDEVGGFNERLAIDFNDVDYCLRVRQTGYRVVFTPHAQLYHHESGTLGPRTQNPAELAAALETWRDVIDRDPYYNPNLTRQFPDYRLA